MSERADGGSTTPSAHLPATDDGMGGMGRVTRRGWFGGRGAGERGQQFAELAIMLPLLAILMLSAIDLGRAFHTYIALTNAAREAARYSAINNVGATSSQVTTELNPPGGTFAGCVSGTLQFTAPAYSSVKRGDPYTVTVSCSFQLVTPLMGRMVGDPTTNRVTMRSSATFVIE